MNKMKTDSRILYNTVIENNYCIGCGACSLVPNSIFKIRLNEFGLFEAYADGNVDASEAKVLRVCPFANESKNENELGEIYFPDIEFDNYIGKYKKCFVGHVQENEFRKKGSSGGIGKWLGAELLKQNEIDYFIQLVSRKQNQVSELLFDYKIFTNSINVVNGSKSAYYPSTLANIVKTIKEQKGRYAITGVPCFIKTIRLLCEQDDILKSRIKFTIGIVCGGMKSANQSKMIGWQLGVHPDNLLAIDFRNKDLGKSASEKTYQVWSKIENFEYKDLSNNIPGTAYPLGFFKPNACDYCDDVVAETADISIGDAWIKQYSKDPQGHSIMVVRNSRILEILEDSNKSENIKLDLVTPTDVYNSQEGGFRHRREGLSYRLKLKQNNSIWVPVKRVVPGQFKLTKKRQKIYKIREELALISHQLFLDAMKNDNIETFNAEIGKLSKKYVKLYYGTVLERIFKKILGIIKF